MTNALYIGDYVTRNVYKSVHVVSCWKLALAVPAAIICVDRKLSIFWCVSYYCL